MGREPRYKLNVPAVGITLTVLVGILLGVMIHTIDARPGEQANIIYMLLPCLVLCLVFWKLPGGAGVGFVTLLIAGCFAPIKETGEMRGLWQALAFVLLFLGSIISVIVGIARRGHRYR